MDNNIEHLSKEDKNELMKNIEKARELLSKGTKIIIKSEGNNQFEEDLNKEINDENSTE